MKSRRQKKIQELITNEPVKTQEELAQRLLEEGFHVTQATVSRDIKEMGLIKISGSDDEYRYAIQAEAHPPGYQERLKRMFKEVVISFDSSENIIVIKTIPGNAQAMALLLDNIGWKEVIGTVAGDDTIFLLIKPKEQIEIILERLTELS
ncbi:MULTISPECIES: arginine repressor [Dehalobacter]|jgi:transcriptional regulator of arginine metabolism|uniref:Arginine repressor n=2 Tax=Dehalobacter restrictus TaxID=55583 RepID=A0A857DHY0_9FIRM|nr:MULTISPECIES: arginine repressor [Dehalobacter]AHF09806.1 arginine repressor ArgR [Dehalobacter restrictus DSM 9455]MCG1026095.1 arginine repressor [Dehalobacter sp.]MDJ0305022.1 arginine repressor [Dehalobacter sp.]OCZ53431.1 arginine repressor [Dehalobacter sp. TeCB1]QHA00393.1 arginine repressor [Dehalobacter restrictus]